MEKKKLLFCGITMNRAGTEKAFLSLLRQLDYNRYDVDLVLAKKDGPLLKEIPKQVRVFGSLTYGEMFLLSGKNAVSTILKTVVRRHPTALLTVVPSFVKILAKPKQKSDIASRLWVRLLRYCPTLEEEYGVTGEYDAAIAFWGDRTMFYMCDKVKAKRKIAWLHFDYAHPKRDDSLYLPYFQQCDYVVNVSEACHEALIRQLPQIREKCVMMENLIDARQIRELALRGDTYPDDFYKGIRVVSVMRICEQKGCDYIVPAMKRLLADGYDFRWYIIGDGDRDAVINLKMQALTEEVADRLILLGAKENPYRFIRDADIFALPSRYEGKPITVEEAKILYVPCAVTDYLSARQQLQDGAFGVIGGEGEEGIYQALKTLLSSKALRNEIADRLTEYDFDNTARVSLFDAMVDGQDNC